MHCMILSFSIANLIVLCFGITRLKNTTNCHWKTKFVFKYLNFFDANQKCISEGGRLAVLKNCFNFDEVLRQTS